MRDEAGGWCRTSRSACAPGASMAGGRGSEEVNMLPQCVLGKESGPLKV